jgi:ABC-type nitrate/sulfonate/bicarbonate transport system substrate-binding protein
VIDNLLFAPYTLKDNSCSIIQNGGRTILNRKGLKVGAAYRTVASGLLAFLLGSCGGAAPTTTDALSGQTLSLEVGIPQANTGETAAYWALGQGVWKRLGLEVTVVHQGPTQSTNIAAGRLAIGVFGTTASFSAVQAGRPVSIVACDISGSSSAGVIVKADSRFQTLQDLSGQRVGVIGASGAAFGSAAAYSNYIQQRGLTQFWRGCGGSWPD